MNYELLRIMGTDEALLFCFLLHHFEVVKPDLPRRHREAGWCWCTADTVEGRLGWNRAKQGRLLAKLKEKGYVECEQHRRRNKRGQPTGGQPVRWVRCRVARVAAALEDATMPAGLPWRRGDVRGAASG